MRFGPKCEAGFIPIFSVETEEEAHQLLTMACPLNADGEYVAPELARGEQTLEVLYGFGDRLRETYNRYVKEDSE